jgi:hypothetical protein
MGDGMCDMADCVMAGGRLCGSETDFVREERPTASRFVDP